jgi:hypothetical protein
MWYKKRSPSLPTARSKLKTSHSNSNFHNSRRCYPHPLPKLKFLRSLGCLFCCGGTMLGFRGTSSGKSAILPVFLLAADLRGPLLVYEQYRYKKLTSQSPFPSPKPQLKERQTDSRASSRPQRHIIEREAAREPDRPKLATGCSDPNSRHVTSLDERECAAQQQQAFLIIYSTIEPSTCRDRAIQQHPCGQGAVYLCSPEGPARARCQCWPLRLRHLLFWLVRLDQA